MVEQLSPRTPLELPGCRQEHRQLAAVANFSRLACAEVYDPVESTGLPLSFSRYRPTCIEMLQCESECVYGGMA